MKSFRKWLVLFSALCGIGLAQQSAKPDQQSTVQILGEWASLQSTWGVISAQPVPNSSLEMVEKARRKNADGRTVFHYNFKATGLPANETYQMEYWPVGGSTHPFQKVAAGVRINAAGLIVCGPQQACGDRDQPEYPLEVAIPQTGIGEPHRFVLTSEKHPKIWVTGLATPFPLIATSGICQLESVRMTPNGEMFLLKGSGFPPNRDLTIAGDSAGQQHTSTTHTDSEGDFQKAELPFVVGKDSGTIDDKIAAGADCHPSISAKWGTGSREIQ